MEKEKISEIDGIIDQIIYTNEENGYTVADFITLEKNITVVGIMPYVYEGESLKLYGSVIVHQEYGEQFKVEAYERNIPKPKALYMLFWHQE